MSRPCPVRTPPATKGAARAVAAPAALALGVCTPHLLRLRLASAAAIRPGFKSSSRSLFRSALSFLAAAILIAITTPTMANITAATPNATGAVTCSMFVSPSVTAAFIVACCLLALVLFHLVIVPAIDWAVRRFG